MAEAQARWEEIDVDGGKMGTYVARPPRGSGPGIVMLQEIFGVNAAMRTKAETFAAAGYVVMVPDIFWRLSPRIDLGYTEDDRKQAFGHMQALDFLKAIGDIGAAYRALTKMNETGGGAAFVGYCLGGKLAVIAASTVGDATAVVSFYGVRLDENIDQIKGLKCPVVIHVGDNDSHIPMTTVHTLKTELTDCDHVDIFVYPGAQHGFFNETREDVFDAQASPLAWDRSLAVLPTAK